MRCANILRLRSSSGKEVDRVCKHTAVDSIFCPKCQAQIDQDLAEAARWILAQLAKRRVK